MQRTTTILVTTLLAAFWAFAASAAPITLTYDGFANGSRSGTLYGVRQTGAAAGQFEFSVVDDGGVYWDTTLNAFCIDVTTNLVTSGQVTYDLVSATSSAAVNASQLSLIGQLYDNHAASLGSATNDAAFQLALWEIIYDYNGVLQLTSSPSATRGAFWSNAFNGAQSVASGWLAGLTVNLNYVSGYEFFVLEPNRPESNQTLLVARQVPEPATLGLLGAGLLAAGALRRRRRR